MHLHQNTSPPCQSTKNGNAMKFAILLCLFILSNSLFGVESFKCKYERDYFVQLPENYDSSKKYWLLVLVHGYRGNGQQIMGVAKKFNFKNEAIIVAPSFPWDMKMGGYYQMLGGNSDKQLIDIFETLGEKHNLHDRMLLWGHSGGSQYSHRFAMKHHKYVLACASSSGGSWGHVSKKASHIPFAISCGEKDTGKSVSMSPMGRLDWFRSYRNEMIKNKMFFVDKVIPGMGHGIGPWCYGITDELFKLTTTGLYPAQREVLKKQVDKLRDMAKSGNTRNLDYEISKLKNLRFPKLKYSKTSVDDTSEEQKNKFQKTANEYGFTSNKKAEKYLSERYKYYIQNVLAPELKSY